MKILHKDGIKTICRDDHPDTEGFERIDIPVGYSIVEKNIVEGVEVEIVKSIETIKSELGL